MEEYNVTRKFPKKWGNKFLRKFNSDDELLSFYKYCKILREDLRGIEKYDRKSFNQKNPHSINDYVSLFDYYLNRINFILLDENKLFEFNKKHIKKKDKYLELLTENLKNLVDYKKFKKNKYFETRGIKRQYHKSVSELAKKIFMIEKCCSSTVKKIWDENLTKFEKFNQYEPFNMIVKIVFPHGWRSDLFIAKRMEKFTQNRKYQSASLINNKSLFCLFNYFNNKESALFIYEPDSSKIVCANKYDAYSDEYINNRNPYWESNCFSSLSLIDSQNIDGDLHDLYANATEVATPNVLLHNGGTYNELVIRDPKIIGVLAPNKNSEKYAKKLATEKNVPYYGVLDMIEKVQYY